MNLACSVFSALLFHMYWNRDWNSQNKRKFAHCSLRKKMWPPPLEFSSSEHEEICTFILVNTFKEQNDKKKRIFRVKNMKVKKLEVIPCEEEHKSLQKSFQLRKSVLEPSTAEQRNPGCWEHQDSSSHGHLWPEQKKGRDAETILIQYDKKSFYSQCSLGQWLFEKAEPHV